MRLGRSRYLHSWRSISRTKRRFSNVGERGALFGYGPRFVRRPHKPRHDPRSSHVHLLTSCLSVWRTLPTFSALCIEGGVPNGLLDVGTCVSINSVATNFPGCADVATAKGTQCSCERRDISGVFVCVDAEPMCVGDTGDFNWFPCEPVFSALFTLKASTTSTYFTPGRLYSGVLYFDFSSDDERMALVHAANATDVYWPCGKLRRLICASSCSATFSDMKLPRLFREKSDVAGCVGAPLTGAEDALVTAGFSCFTKQLSNPSTGDTIKWIWAASRAGRWELGAAVAVDGSVWQFRREDGAIGSHLGTIVPPNRLSPPQIPLSLGGVVDLATLGGVCEATSCSSSAEVVQLALTAIPSSGGVRTLVVDVMNSMQGSSFGFAQPTATGFSASGSSTASASTVTTFVQSMPAASLSSADYFRTMVLVIDHFWPLSSSSPPRRLVVMTGYPHVSASSYTAQGKDMRSGPSMLSYRRMQMFRPAALPEEFSFI